MTTVILDYDSTLINCESLEEILKSKHLDPARMEKIKDLTEQGMSGNISFVESLEKRIGVMELHKQDFEDFGKHAINYLTPGMKEFVEYLQSHHVDIWILSGAAEECILPVAKYLKIDLQHVKGLEITWSTEGKYLGIDFAKAINRDKWEEAQELKPRFNHPIIAIGDGMTDYAIYSHHIADVFIAYTGNVRRPSVIEHDVKEAKSVDELKNYVNEYIV
jgi:HAD superfamily phosphoserine phosphatase-like hydrolase